MNEIVIYKEIADLHDWATANFLDISRATKNISKHIRNQQRFNRNLVIFSIAITVYSLAARNRITEQELRIKKLENKISESSIEE